jgi:hypothetical protein
MLSKFKSICFVVCFLLLQSVCFSQTTKSLFLNAYEAERSKKLTSLKTNTLAEIFQASLKSGIITTKGNDIGLKSTIFQLHKLWKPEIITEDSYKKQTFARNFEFGIAVKINESNKINAFGSSFKYAIVNNRDISLQNKKYLDADIKKLEAAIDALVGTLHNQITKKIQNAIRNPSFKKEDKDGVLNALSSFSTNNSDVQSFKKLGENLKPFFPVLEMQESDFNAINYAETREAIRKQAEELEDNIKKRGLLTLNFGNNYKDKAWDSLAISLEYIKGLGLAKDKDKPWDIYAAAFCDFKQDTVTKNSLGRQVFTAKLGLNKVLLKNRKENNSFLEILGSAEYTHVLKGLYAKESRGVFMADFTLSIRLSQSVFLPVEIKYDPKNGNVFGFLKVKWDLPRTSGKG